MHLLDNPVWHHTSQSLSLPLPAQFVASVFRAAKSFCRTSPGMRSQSDKKRFGMDSFYTIGLLALLLLLSGVAVVWLG